MALWRRAVLALSTLAVVSAAGCGSSTTPTDNNPPTASKKETFTGTVAVGGASTHNFTVTLSNGTLSMTLTAAGPPATVSMGIGLGQPSDSGCVLYPGASVITAASATPQFAIVVNGGASCVAIVDVGFQTGPIDYALTVSHY